ncbi:hypothetical protein PR202_gb10169 [Eleusine coracana subsp. coracana]|uniref:Uncharacterized protein n=1 Tax=Eleusine coracana subsp. coracana TaxID=191504 RepID=A0AAV5EGU8_ELECO|nr:hypothetical protein PR202_gb10169 [Eleusine coracana subsp. coracana]
MVSGALGGGVRSSGDDEGTRDGGVEGIGAAVAALGIGAARTGAWRRHRTTDGVVLLPNLILSSSSSSSSAAAMSSSLLLLPSSASRRVLRSPPPQMLCITSSSRVSFPLRPRRTHVACAADPNGAASSGSGSGSGEDAAANTANSSLVRHLYNPLPSHDLLIVFNLGRYHRDLVKSLIIFSPTQVAENLAQLMYSVLMTGYMFRNAQYRLELQQSLEQIALPEPKEEKDLTDYAPGTKKKVTGEVIRWNKATGPEKIDAVKYIELLEAEIDELSRQVTGKSSQGSNELLEYLKSLEPQNLKELASTAGEDVVFAMNAFIKRLLAVSDPAQMKTTVSETSANQLANLLFWLMIVGYSMRNIEVRFDMERVLGAPPDPKLAELPPGENIS